MAVNLVEFDMENPLAVEFREKMIKLCEGAAKLRREGFSPKRMDKYPVEIFSMDDGAILVTLTVKESATEKITFDLHCFSDGENLDMCWKEIYENKMTVGEQFSCLPLS